MGFQVEKILGLSSGKRIVLSSLKSSAANNTVWFNCVLDLVVNSVHRDKLLSFLSFVSVMVYKIYQHSYSRLQKGLLWLWSYYHFFGKGTWMKVDLGFI